MSQILGGYLWDTSDIPAMTVGGNFKCSMVIVRGFGPVSSKREQGPQKQDTSLDILMHFLENWTVTSQ